jgi:response regulator RpfG family c-di-GMP phosphodiesterase
MTEKKIKVLYVDDEENNLFSFKAVFRLNYQIYTAISGSKALEILNENPDIEVILTDQRMPEMTGVEFLKSILPIHPDPVRILLTGYADLKASIDAVNEGKIFHYLSKPWNEDEVNMIIQKAHEVYIHQKNEREMKGKLIQTADQMEFLLRQSLLS